LKTRCGKEVYPNGPASAKYRADDARFNAPARRRTFSAAGGWILVNRRTPNRASRRKMLRSTDSSREIQRRQVLVKTAAVRRQQRQERGTA